MLQKEIIIELEERVSKIHSWAVSLTQIPDLQLRAKPSDTGWSALECIDHLNRYNQFYIPIFESGVAKSKEKTSENYKPGWLGNKMAKDMLPSGGKLKLSMKTFKSKNPSIDGIDPHALDKFIAFQTTLLSLLDHAKFIDLTDVRVSTTLPLLKLKLGDALRFVIYHEVRHVDQAQRALHNRA